MRLCEAVGQQIVDILKEKNMTQYQLFIKSGVPRSTIGNLIKCSYNGVNLRIIHEICQGFEMELEEFFSSHLFREANLEP